ncbi:MAG TPA: DUF4142 domain-containing protein [Candidatus Acidoferrum sp.]|nr:DUF4142 domain-containing protein [Candidatus Acidoferrum sp.]
MLKMFQTNKIVNAKTTLTFAVCTLLALSGASLRAQDQDVDSKSDIDAKGAAGANAASQSGGKLSRSDKKFIEEACKGGKMEIHMGKLGVEKAQNDQVKQYAQRLIDDHTKAGTELKQLASQKGVTLPEEKIVSGTTDSDRTKVRETEGSDHKEHAGMKKLQGLSGTEFDREFVRMAVKDHEKDVKEFEKAAEKADDADVKAFAQKTVPTLREHLQQAKSLETQVGSSSN